MKNNKIAIVNSSSFGKIFPKHINELKKVGSVEFFQFDQNIPGNELAKALKGYNYIIASVTPFFTKEFFENIEDLRLISRHGIGYNNIDLEAAAKHNTIVSLVPALVERDSVAEQTITNLLNLMRKVCLSYQEVKEDRWENRANFVGHTLFNKTVGIIGLGNTGSCIAETLRNGFRCEVIAYDPNKSKLEMQMSGVKKVDLESLLKGADVICLSANLTQESLHLIGNKEVEIMKEGVYISNSARGALVDEEAILSGLGTKKIAGYATDVLETEPGRASHPLLDFPNVIITPHTGAYTMECLEAMGNKCVEDVLKVMDGKFPVRSVQSQSIYIKKV
ncbi:D-isomer specific 2-hydroxyacid dehydrogenase family protein [Ignavigranum ruoffiae]|uniref:D-isomer specific 2-hydroxyacid dehydrogenase family protein n=1 Tax=Ignavigranum ruoffiae TaxID=89093 RepID=UPI00204A4B1C|nr:D-isomer specific 2-hydroxyacid dehydrogenase family protein [Ignavigranum ruoffiae]UPQ86607.1 D-isomer specific 2-hydroxyacid dehydrogenase family protein [Ignavigranum ruoffiae]